MFKKAVQEHSGSSAKPLQPTLPQNSGKPPFNPAPQSIGVKRKIEMADAGQSALGSLHSAVYFDENDFDDDDDLNFEEPDTFMPPAKIVRPNVQGQGPGGLADSQTASSMQMKPPSQPASILISSDSADVKYPELPPMPDDNPAPPSSAQIPWSSSPLSHFQKPNNPRTVPWATNQQSTPVEPPPKKVEAPVHRPKPTALWEKSASAIKEEQRQLRRQNKSLKTDTKKPQPRPKLASVFLSDEQRHVLEAVVHQGKSIFFTGSAGTGKSVLMREIIKQLQDKYRREPDRVAVTASTGLAACNIGGVTLHSFAGIGLGKEQVPELVKKVG